MATRFAADKLCRFTKQQLIHLLADVVGIDELNQTWESMRGHQVAEPRNLRCWDCEGIAKHLEEL